MIALALLLQAAAATPAPPPVSVDGSPLGGLPRQALPARGCAAYLFSRGATRTLVAMATAESATLRIAVDGVTLDLARAGQAGEAGYGFARTLTYRAGDTTATLELAITQRADVTAGAVVSEATLTIERPGRDGAVVPLAGLVGCV